MNYSTDYSKTRFGRVTFITLATAAALLLMPMQATPAKAGALGGALGGALFGGLLGVPILGAVMGGVIGGAAKDKKRRRRANSYQQQMDNRQRPYRR
jgi:hypothetical protein